MSPDGNKPAPAPALEQRQEIAARRSKTGDEVLARAHLARILASLVQTSSINPGVYESGVAQRIIEWLSTTPLEVEVVEFAPGRPSVAAVLSGAGSGPRLVLNGHMDTVPIDDLERWTTDPFGGAVRDGFLYGRGACDMKAGLTVQIAVAQYFALRADRMLGSLILHFAAGEEHGEPGTLSLLDAGYTGDFGITTEPTQLDVATATRGLVFFRVRLLGRSIHAGRAHLGLNPIPAVGAVLGAVARYQEEMAETVHPLLGSGTCTPTLVDAGVAENAVPDMCDLVFDRRLVPGETVERELARFDTHLDAVRSTHPELGVELTVLHRPFEPAEIDSSSDFAHKVLDTVERVRGEPGELFGAPFASDVRNLVNDAGIEAVTFGPGDVTYAHAADERVAIQELEDAARVIAAVASDLLLDGS